MDTKVISLNPVFFSDHELSEAADAIRRGKLVAFPTETVYGLGANALDGPACDSIFEAKGRPHDNPLIVHVSKAEDFEHYAEIPDRDLFDKLARQFIPGPLTIVLPKKKVIPESVTVGLDTVALRCPEHPIARALIRLSGVPIAAPSANLSGKPSPTTAEHVISDMTGRIPYIIAGGSSEVGLESTVISLKKGKIHLLRPGYVTYEDLCAVCNDVVVSEAVLSALKDHEKAESPGMKYRHYAPDSPVTMVRGGEGKVLSFFQSKLSEGCAVLCYEEDVPRLQGAHIFSLGKRDDFKEQAHRLFDVLRKVDGLNLPHIYTRETSTNHLGLAVSNRLLRACAFDVVDLEEI